MTVEPAVQLQRQRFRMRSWVRNRLWAQVIAGLVAGLLLGIVLGPDTGWLEPATADVLGRWLALPGQLFLGLIAMVLVPLIFASVVGGLTGAGSGQELRDVGLRFGAFVLLTTTAAAWAGIGLAIWLQPGRPLAGLLQPAAVATGGETVFDLARIPAAIANVLPTNPTAAIANGDMLAVVVLALLVGIAATQIDRDRVRPFLALLDALLSISMTVVKWAMYLAPWAVLGLMAQLVMRTGLETVIGMSAYVGTVLLGLALLMLLYLAVAALAGIGPRRFLQEAGGTLLLAFSTSSSSAIMPMTIGTAKRLGVPDRIGNLVVPLGATMNMAGTALYQSVAILFLAQISGVDMGLAKIALISTTLVVSSIGAPGTPGVSIAILMSVAAAAGIPAEGVVIILGVDRILDMCRTTVNVSGDLVACLLLRHRTASGGARGGA